MPGTRNPHGPRTSGAEQPIDEEAPNATQHAIDDVAPGQEGQDREPAHSKVHDCLANLRMTWIDHLAAAKVPQRLGSATDREVDPGQVEVELWIEEFLLRCGFTERAGRFEIPIAEGDRQAERGADLRVIGRLGMGLAQGCESRLEVVRLELKPAPLERFTCPRTELPSPRRRSRL